MAKASAIPAGTRRFQPDSDIPGSTKAGSNAQARRLPNQPASQEEAEANLQRVVVTGYADTKGVEASGRVYKEPLTLAEYLDAPVDRLPMAQRYFLF